MVEHARLRLVSLFVLSVSLAGALVHFVTNASFAALGHDNAPILSQASCQDTSQDNRAVLFVGCSGFF